MNRRISISLLLAGLSLSAVAQPANQIRQPRLPDGATTHRDLAYVTKGHERQKLDLFLPKDGTNWPLIIHIHGGAFKAGSKEQGVPLNYLSQGYAVASINYRLSQHAIFPAQIEDCKAAVRWLRAHAAEYRLDPTRVAVWGPSAGGHLAALLGTTGDTKEFDVGENLDQSSRIQAVVDYFGPTDFLQMDAHRLPSGMVHDGARSPESELIGGAIQDNKAKAARANPITYVTPGDPPFLICHGDQDPLVPHHQSELLEAALKQAGVPVTFYTVKGAGHGGFKDPKVPEMTREFLAKHLKPAQSTQDRIIDLSQVPQLHETEEQRDVRLQWFRDAKFGMFIHWGPCTVGDREIGWGRRANRPWDINGQQTPRTSDPDYDTYFQRFNPEKYDADAWVRLAQEAGMKYMVLISKHHDGFSQFDSKLTDYDIMAAPYGRDIVRRFVDACHRHGMKVGLYYSTRDWFHPDYLVGDNAKYDTWYRGQVEELLANYGRIDLMWFDHVGGRDWGKWRFDQLFAMMYRLQPGLVVNNRAARFCGPASPEDRGPATPEIRKMTDGDFDTPEQHIGAMNLKRDWESCMILSPTPQGDGWSYRSAGKTRPLDECIRMLASTASGGGNLLLNFGPDQFGAFRPEEVAIAQGMGAWLKRFGEAIYGTRGGPFTNGKWGGSTHRGHTVYLHLFDWPGDTLRLAALPQKITQARLLPGGAEIAFAQTARGVDVTVPAGRRDDPVTVIALTLDQPVPRGQQVGSVRARFEDEATYGRIVSENATFRLSSPSVHDRTADHAKLFRGEKSDRGFAFHTGDEMNPWVRIDLGRVVHVTGLTIENRPGERRTDGLVLSISENGEQWTRIWSAPSWQPVWEVPVSASVAGAEVPGRAARYLKLETNPAKPAPMLLQRVEVYGK